MKDSIQKYIKLIRRNSSDYAAISELSSLLVQYGYRREAIKLLDNMLQNPTNGNNGFDIDLLLKKKQFYESNYKVIAIHQPDYFPWLGYFHKIYYSDIFIILDNVEFSKSSLTRRSHILKSPSSTAKRYITLPLKKHSDFSLIKDLSVDYSQKWQQKHINQIRGAYNKTPFFHKYFPHIERMILECSNLKTLSEVNVYLLKSLLNILSIKDNTVLSSSFSVNGKRSELNINLVKHCNGNVYISGRGALDYQNDSEFNEAGIKVIYQNIYNFLEMHPYKQCQGEFVNSLSVLDALFNIGPEGIMNIFDNYENILFEHNCN